MSPTPKRYSRSYHYSRPSVKWKFPLNTSFCSDNTYQRQQELDDESQKREESDRSQTPKYVNNKIHKNHRQVARKNGSKVYVKSKSVNERIYPLGQSRSQIKSYGRSEGDRSCLPNSKIGNQSLQAISRQVKRKSFTRNRKSEQFVSVQRVRKTSFSRRPLKMIVPDRIIRQRSSLSLTGIDGFDELNLQTSCWTRFFRSTLRGQKLLKFCLLMVAAIFTVLVLKHKLFGIPPLGPSSHMTSGKYS